MFPKISSDSGIPALIVSRALLREGYLLADYSGKHVKSPDFDRVGILDPIISRTFGFLDSRFVGIVSFGGTPSSTRPLPAWEVEVFSSAYKKSLFDIIEPLAEERGCDLDFIVNEIGFLSGGEIRMGVARSISRAVEDIHLKLRFRLYGNKYKL